MTVLDHRHSPALQMCKAIGAILQGARRFACKKPTESPDVGAVSKQARTQIKALIPTGGLTGIRRVSRRFNAANGRGVNLQELADSRTHRLQDETRPVLAGGLA